MMSWLRSTLALVVGITVTMHHVIPGLGVIPASLLGLAGTGLAVASYASAYSRLLRSELPAATGPDSRSAVPFLLLALATVVGGLCAALFAARALI